MAKSDNLTDFLTDVADAIREKKGTTEKINPQDFSNEIREIETGGEPSPWAVDFGEEIATNNAVFVNALQEDIDYYNEIKRKLASGEVSATTLRDDRDFRSRIAWLPSEVQYDGRLQNEYINLRYVELSAPVTNGYYMFQYCAKLIAVKADFSNLRHGKIMFKGCSSLKEIDLQNAPLTNGDNMFSGCVNLRKISGLNVANITNASGMFIRVYLLHEFPSKLVFSKATSASNFLDGFNSIEEVDVEFPEATNCLSCVRTSDSLITARLHIPKATSVSYTFTECPNLENAYISGLRASLSISDREKITAESVKYILDNCLVREDGASYTLTLHANVKSAFLAKCDEDAEYAASLANANAKGLTLA